MMSEDTETIRRRSREAVHAAIQANPPPEFVEKGALLTQWAVVAEWVTSDGEKWLSRLESEGLTAWDRKGMLFEVLWNWDEAEEGEPD